MGVDVAVLVAVASLVGVLVDPGGGVGVRVGVRVGVPGPVVAVLVAVGDGEPSGLADAEAEGEAEGEGVSEARGEPTAPGKEPCVPESSAASESPSPEALSPEPNAAQSPIPRPARIATAAMPPIVNQRPMFELAPAPDWPPPRNGAPQNSHTDAPGTVADPHCRQGAPPCTTFCPGDDGGSVSPATVPAATLTVSPPTVPGGRLTVSCPGSAMRVASPASSRKPQFAQNLIPLRRGAPQFSQFT